LLVPAGTCINPDVLGITATGVEVG
jgi:hypothetical protein